MAEKKMVTIVIVNNSISGFVIREPFLKCTVSGHAFAENLKAVEAEIPEDALESFIYRLKKQRPAAEVIVKALPEKSMAKEPAKKPRTRRTRKRKAPAKTEMAQQVKTEKAPTEPEKTNPTKTEMFPAGAQKAEEQ